MYKLKFEREAMGVGFPVNIYSTYNVIYSYKEFNRDLHVKFQVIRHSGVGGHHHNWVAYNEINNVVRISRTMMIHATLRCNYYSENILCPMDMAHYVHLQNHTPHISSCLFPEEVWTGSKSSNSALQNAHPWG